MNTRIIGKSPDIEYFHNNDWFSDSLHKASFSLSLFFLPNNTSFKMSLYISAFVGSKFKYLAITEFSSDDSLNWFSIPASSNLTTALEIWYLVSYAPTI